jgi:hypothetical protein
MRVQFSQRGRVLPSPRTLQGAQSNYYSTQPSVRPHGLSRYAYKPPTCRPRLRVLCTQTTTKGAQYLKSPSHTAPLLNWSSTIHRKPHFSPSTMTGATQKREHAGHSHHHHHHHDNTFLLSKNKNDAGVRITKIGLYVNLGMAVSKGFGGYVFNSQGEMRVRVVYERQLTPASTHRRCYPQSHRPRERHHDARNCWLVPQAAHQPLPQRIRKGREFGLARCQRHPACRRLLHGLDRSTCPLQAVLPRSRRDS